MKNINYLDKNSFRVIKELINETQYLRGLAQKTKLAPSSIHKITQKLLQNKLITKTKDKNRIFFSLNYSNVETQEIVKLYFIHNIIASPSFKRLKQLPISKILLFGSMSKGIVDKNSDIDLAIITNEQIKPIELSKIKILLSKEMEREIQLVQLNNISSNHENSETLKSIQNSIELWSIQKK